MSADRASGQRLTRRPAGDVACAVDDDAPDPGLERSAREPARVLQRAGETLLHDVTGALAATDDPGRGADVDGIALPVHTLDAVACFHTKETIEHGRLF